MSRSAHARRGEAMPTFVIEARDGLALETMAYYSDLCEWHGFADRSEQAHRAYRQMAEWRVGHRDEREDVDDVRTARPDLTRLHWQLCGNCGTIFHELTLRCPACGYEHTDKDVGPGPWSGTRTEMEQERS